MLLCWQSGVVRIGEVIRYTLTYTPSEDRILPSPSHLHVKIKNTSAIPLRAAYLHGPYTVHVAAYPATFNPNQKFESASRDGVPEFEPNVKAGGHWIAKLVVPEDIREGGSKMNVQRNTDGSPKSVRWIIEVTSQILFSNSASVHFEVLVGRDERSLDLGFAAIAGKGHGEPGQLHDLQEAKSGEHKHFRRPKGVYSRAVDLVIEDTHALWSKPPLPQWELSDAELKDAGIDQANLNEQDSSKQGPKRRKKPKKLHLVILTHGLHSNIGADMLYMKESIDATAKKARVNAKKRKASLRKSNTKGAATDNQTSGDPNNEKEPGVASTAPISGGQDEIHDEEVDRGDESDDEEVIVRGFPGNAVRTERGIKYLGRRLAKYILTTTYPDQPFLPASKSLTKSFPGSFSNKIKSPLYGEAAHAGSSVQKIAPSKDDPLPYTFTSISFVGHSLGGLTQTYAIAYIHKHSPEFFNHIKPVNFVCLASPLLGLSNENPIYVKFALDFGLVGRTGQDLGLTWRPPTLARSGWSAMIAGLGSKEEQPKQQDPSTKPLLRILPTGPAHEVLQKFRNRTVYSNVVNDGIVPLRTSCLLFLDWRGLERVENARRENGLISTMASVGWAELTGANTAPHKPSSLDDPDNSDSDEGISPGASTPRNASAVPQPAMNTTIDDTQSQMQRPDSYHSLHPERPRHASSSSTDQTSQQRSTSPFSDFINFFRPNSPDPTPSKPPKVSKRAQETYTRAQTIERSSTPEEGQSADAKASSANSPPSRPSATRGDSLTNDSSSGPPPKTSVFEAARDILNPNLPSVSWLTDPSSRSRSIFHDRIYHPDDIPPPPAPKASRSSIRPTSGGGSQDFGRPSGRPSLSSQDSREDVGGLKVEEKIARAYHRDLSWRKVLVRLEPDAHNNMIVRRMFANAHGWDVVKHLCDTHFADTYAALTKDEKEPSTERAKQLNKPVTNDAEEVHGQSEPNFPERHRGTNENHEAGDEISATKEPKEGAAGKSPGSGSRRSKDSTRYSREDSATWSDSAFEASEDGYDSDDENLGPMERFQRFWAGPSSNGRSQSEAPPRTDGPLSVQTDAHGGSGRKDSHGTEFTERRTQSPVKIDGHRGLGIIEQLNATHPTFQSEEVEPLAAEDARPDGGDQIVLEDNETPTLSKPEEAHVRNPTESPNVERVSSHASSNRSA